MLSDESFSRVSMAGSAASLDLGVDAWGGIGFDPDASRYIAALGVAGVVASDAQRNVINAFIKGEKASQRWNSHKRIYLPIWGVAAANAICMKSLTSGTFTGGVTHGAGFCQSDGTTGRMTMGATPAGLGLASGDYCLGSLVYTAPTRSYENHISSYLGGNTIALMSANSITVFGYGFLESSSARVYFNPSNFNQHRGIWLFTHKVDATPRRLYKRDSGGITGNAVDGASGASGSLPTGTFTAMADARIVNLATCSYGAWTVGLGMAAADAPAFTLAIKNLWETCTGLALP